MAKATRKAQETKKRGRVDFVRAGDCAESRALLERLADEGVQSVRAADDDRLPPLDFDGLCELAENYDAVHVAVSEVRESLCEVAPGDRLPGRDREEIESVAQLTGSELALREDLWDDHVGDVDTGYLGRPIVIVGKHLFVGFNDELAETLLDVAANRGSPARYTLEVVWETWASDAPRRAGKASRAAAVSTASAC